VVKSKYGIDSVFYKAIPSSANYNMRLVVGSVIKDGSGIGEETLNTIAGIALNIPREYTIRGTEIEISASSVEALSARAMSSSASASASCSAFYLPNSTPVSADAGLHSASSSVGAVSLPSYDLVAICAESRDGTISQTPVSFSTESESESDPDGSSDSVRNYVPDTICYVEANASASTNASRSWKIVKEADRWSDLDLQESGNDIYIEVREGVVNIWLNDHLILANFLAYTVTEGFAGLGCRYKELSEYLNETGDNHISAFKVWSNDIPEPPDDESGHGTYSGEKGFRYTDKYHKSDGEGGYTYDPNA
jgi:hypothetical protein